MTKIYAIILAGGTGSRMGTSIPKQFLQIGGKPVIVHTIEKFQNHPEIDSICMVVHPDYMPEAEEIMRKYAFNKIGIITAGGETRQGSSYNALNSTGFHDDDILLFHDAARPFAREAVISGCVSGVKEYGAAAVCVPSTDTLMLSDSDGWIAGIPDRGMMFNAQTPQGFRYAIIRRAHNIARDRGVESATDDVRLVLDTGVKVKIVPGDYDNIKITTPNDLAVAEVIASRF